MGEPRSAAAYMEQGQKAADDVVEGAQEYTEALQEQISRYPISAVLIAIGIGWLIGSVTWRH